MKESIIECTQIVFSKLITVHKCHVRYYVMAINLSTFLIETKKNVQARRVRIVLL